MRNSFVNRSLGSTNFKDFVLSQILCRTFWPSIEFLNKQKISVSIFHCIITNIIGNCPQNIVAEISFIKFNRIIIGSLFEALHENMENLWWCFKNSPLLFISVIERPLLMLQLQSPHGHNLRLASVIFRCC